MKTKKSEYVERFTVGVNADTATAIRKSGQSAPDWLRQAARNRIDGERQAEPPSGKLEKQMAALPRAVGADRSHRFDLHRSVA